MKIKKILFLGIILVNIKLLSIGESNESDILVLRVIQHSVHSQTTGSYSVIIEVAENRETLQDFFKNKTIIREDCFQTEYSDGTTSRIQRDEEGLYWLFSLPGSIIKTFDHDQGYLFKHEVDPVTKKLKRIRK